MFVISMSVCLPSLMFVSNTGACPNIAPFRCSLPRVALPTNIRLGWKACQGPTF